MFIYYLNETVALRLRFVYFVFITFTEELVMEVVLIVIGCMIGLKALVIIGIVIGKL